MKIVITTVQIPFVQGGAELHARNLKQALIEAGHEVDIVTMPFMGQPIDVIEDYIVASRLMNVRDSWVAGHTDFCIGLKFPAYYMPHPNKVVWALHQHREAYELFDTDYGNMRDDEKGNAVRRSIYNADRQYLSEAKHIFANSENVAGRMLYYTGLTSTPLYHPCPDMEKFYHEEYGDYILMPSRINVTKRQMLALDAMMLTRHPVKLCIVGKTDNEKKKREFLEHIRECGLEDRVTYLDFVSQEKKLELYAKAKAVLFIPFDEDYGYITLEGMAASKPVITMKDSGGPLEFIEDDMTGIVSEPTAEELARHLDELWTSKTMAAEYGAAANKKLRDMDITWAHVVEELVKYA